MQLVVVDPVTPDRSAIARAAELLRAGRLVAFPTETVYGLGANALDAAAVERIYRAKGRPNYNPLIVHVLDEAGVLTVAREWPDTAAALARAFWPGPLTVVVRKLPIVPDGVTAGLDTVAVRVPAHPVARALLAAARIPVAAPSANRSMLLSPTTAQHVFKSLGESADMILDAGPSAVGIESTVIDLTRARPTLLRPGMISIPQLESVIGPIERAGTVEGEAARSSPGMMDRHYSPRAPLVVVDAAELPMIAERERAAGRIVGALTLSAATDAARTIRMPADAAGYASRLFASLHELDEVACDVIIVERVPDSPEWLGVQDRLMRAARG